MAVRPPEVAETAKKALPAPLQKHSRGTSTVDGALRACISLVTQPVRQVTVANTSISELNSHLRRVVTVDSSALETRRRSESAYIRQVACVLWEGHTVTHY